MKTRVSRIECDSTSYLFNLVIIQELRSKTTYSGDSALCYASLKYFNYTYYTYKIFA